MNNVTCQRFIIFLEDNFCMFFQNEINTRDLTTFCLCWRSTGDNIEELESPAGCGRLGNYSKLRATLQKEIPVILSITRPFSYKRLNCGRFSLSFWLCAGGYCKTKITRNSHILRQCWHICFEQ